MESLRVNYEVCLCRKISRMFIFLLIIFHLLWVLYITYFRHCVSVSYRSSSCWFFSLRFTFVSFLYFRLPLRDLYSRFDKSVHVALVLACLWSRDAWLVYGPSFSFLLLRWFKFKFLVFMILTSVIFNTHCSCVSLYIGIIIRVFCLINCWVQILFIYFTFLLWRWCFSARKNMVIWLYHLNSLPPLLRYTHNLHSRYTVSHCVNLHLFYLRVNAAFYY